MKIAYIIVLTSCTFLSFGQKKQVCISFDDLPVVSYEKADPNFEKNLIDKLILSLKTYKIPAIGFVNGCNLYCNGSIIQHQIELLKDWVGNGLYLGNHTFSHFDYSLVPLKKYSADILKDESITKEIFNKNSRLTRYFRHPYLHLGNTKAKADSLNDFLLKHGYKVAPVTITHEDYLFAFAYEMAKEKKNTVLMLHIGHDYMSYMERRLKYFEEQAYRLFNRNISQILLLHASSLNSDYMDSLVIMFKRNKYVFVSMDKALKDDAYKTAITAYGDSGISWIDRWALSKGKKGRFFKDEPTTPYYIKKMSELD